MKKLLIGLLLSVVLVFGCANTQEIEEVVFPHSFIPQDVVNQIESEDYIILGSYVSDTGGIVVFVEGDLALLFIPYASDVYSMTHDEARQVYQELCVEEDFCNNNPYILEGESDLDEI